MLMESILEYRCGHPERVLMQGNINRKRSLKKQLIAFTDRIPKRQDGKLECRCPKCGRGAGWMTLKINGVVVMRNSVDDMVKSGELSGAEVSVGPDQIIN